jgi:hypothetical protein
MKRCIATIVIAGVAIIGMAQPGTAASHHKTADPNCSITQDTAGGSTYLLSAWGIPTSTAINLWVTDPNGSTTGSPLGATPDGTFNTNESSSFDGTWTYTFSGPVRHNMDVYATCSVSVGY